jgi:hypothetical protein
LNSYFSESPVLKKPAVVTPGSPISTH